jgi:prefoldin subunit 5
MDRYSRPAEANLAALEREKAVLEKVEDSLKAKLVALERRQEEVRAALEKATKPERNPQEKKD